MKANKPSHQRSPNKTPPKTNHKKLPIAPIVALPLQLPM